jgi:hypothetical protein
VTEQQQTSPDSILDQWMRHVVWPIAGLVVLITAVACAMGWLMGTSDAPDPRMQRRSEWHFAIENGTIGFFRINSAGGRFPQKLWDRARKYGIGVSFGQDSRGGDAPATAFLVSLLLPGILLGLLAVDAARKYGLYPSIAFLLFKEDPVRGFDVVQTPPKSSCESKGPRI